MKRCVLTALCLLGAGGAVAKEDSYSVTVRASDFDNAQTVAALHQRIREQSRSVCPNYFVSRDLRGMRQCRSEVEADLVGKIDHPLLNAYVEGKAALRVALAQRNRTGDRS